MFPLYQLENLIETMLSISKYFGLSLNDIFSMDTEEFFIVVKKLQEFIEDEKRNLEEKIPKNINYRI